MTPDRRAADIGQTALPVTLDERRGKMPRQYASEIMALATREERAAALVNVPEIYREWVEFYVRDWFSRPKVEKK